MKVAKNTNKGKSSKKISIRLKEIDLSIIKKKAEEQGLPYQTLINSILHQRVRKRNS